MAITLEELNASIEEDEKKDVKKKSKLTMDDIDASIAEDTTALDTEPQEEPTSAGNLAGFVGDPSFGLSELERTGETLAREEATFAEPLLNIIRDLKGPRFGEEQAGVDMLDDAVKGAKGQTMSRFKKDRQAELGDIGREFGLPEGISASLGLLLSMGLPSNLATVGLAKVAQRGAGKKLIKQAAAKTDDIMGAFSNLFRNAKKQTPQTKQRLAEVLSMTSGVDVDKIFVGMKNPEWIKSKFATNEFVGDLADDFADEYVKLRRVSPELLSPSDEIPNALGRQIVDEFQTIKKIEGSAVKAVKDKGRGITQEIAQVDDVFNAINTAARDSGAIDQFGNMKVGTQLGNAFKSLVDDVSTVVTRRSKGLGTKATGLTFDNLDDILGMMDNVVYSSKSFAGQSESVIKQVNSAVQNSLRNARTGIRKVIGDAFPEIAEPYAKFSAMKNVQTKVAGKAGTQKQIASSLRRLESAKPEQLLEINELLDFIPNGNKHRASISNFVDLKNSSIDNLLNLSNKSSKGEIADSISGLLKTDTTDIASKPGTSNSIQRLIDFNKKMRNVFEGKAKHEVSKAFTKQASIWRSVVSAGAGASGGAAIGLPGVIAGAAAGGMLSQPRVLGEVIKAAPKISRFSGAVTAATKGAISKTPTSLKAAVGRRSLQNFAPEQEG